MTDHFIRSSKAAAAGCAGHLDSGQCVLFDEDIYSGQGGFVSGELREVDGAMRFVPHLDPHPSIMC